MSVFQKKTEYILMNKDCRVLSFLCIRNEYDEPTFQELQWFVEDPDRFSGTAEST